MSRDTQTWIELSSYTRLLVTHKGKFSFRETGLLSFISHVFVYWMKKRFQIFLDSTIATGILFPSNFLSSENKKTQKTIKRLATQPWVTRMANLNRLDISLIFRGSKFPIFRFVGLTISYPIHLLLQKISDCPAIPRCLFKGAFTWHWRRFHPGGKNMWLIGSMQFTGFTLITDWIFVL